ncbi:protein LIAT1 [Megalops cyprinoides]|uniref:protein LIAT1 n=1 Tax=Megalops cyprinoides TaxID=118141 RepID=UPI00186439F7|nr:protein LIAT1 [Megalops cyprinoides]
MATLTLRRGGREKEAVGNGTEFKLINKTKDLPSLIREKACHGLPASEVKDREKRKKKKKDTTKDKKKAANSSKKRGHSSTPSNSDDTDKPLSEPVISTSPVRTRAEPERTGTPQAKLTGQPRPRGEKGTRKNRRKQEEESVPEPAVAPPTASPQEEASLSSSAQESLRWEGVKEDPAEEEQRLEIYRANRRRRYLFAQQGLPANVMPAAVQEWGHLIQGGVGGTA